MIWIAVPSPAILYLSLDFIHGFLPYRFCVQKSLFCFLMLSFAIWILSCWLKETFPASHLQMNFPTSSYCFYDFHSWMLKKKKKKNPPFGIVPDVWCEIWIQFFFFPQMGYSTTPFIEKSIFAFTFVLIFLCVDFYIVLKFISKDIVLLILAVLNVFPIRRFNCLLLVHNKFIAFCLLLSMSHYFPEFSHSL